MKNYLLAIITFLLGADGLSQTFPTDYPVTPATKPVIVQVEYFIDTDPGLGNGVQVPLVAPYNNTTDISGMNIRIDFGGTLTQNIHTLFIRAKDANGIWSIVNFSKFDNPPQTQFLYPVVPTPAPVIVQAEYFIDTDPGAGNGIQVPLTAPYNHATDISGMNILVDFQGSLSQQTHTLFIRTKDTNGIWSIVNFSKFDNPPQTQIPYSVAPLNAPVINNVEYFIDNDPGPGLAAKYNFIRSNNLTLPNVIADIPAGLIPGIHHLFVRSSQDKWSITNQKDFLVYVSPFKVAPSVVNFGAVAMGYSKSDSITIKNVSTITKLVNSVNIPAPFSSSFTGPVNLAPNAELKIYIDFTPTTQLFYSNTLTITTSDGTEDVTLQGDGAAPVSGWSVSPSPTYSFGNIALNNNSINTFVVTNLGNTPITFPFVHVAGIDSSAFTANMPNATIPIGGQANIQVMFAPTAVQQYDATLAVKTSTTANLMDATTIVSGHGYIPGTAPVLQFLQPLPFNGIQGVDPEAGSPGAYTYKVLYKSSNNLSPQPGFPKLGLDRNGDQDYLDMNEGLFTMNKVGTGSDYVTGVVYEYIINFSGFTTGLGYQFFANDANGNSAATAYTPGPVITDQLLDLKIFASDLSFNNANPDPNQSFIVTAQIHNESPFSALNVPVKFYKDSILLDSIIVPGIAANTTRTISKSFSFATDGFYPIKVWIDSSGTLGEGNVLNNYAIRPVTVGQFSLPGGIHVTSNAGFQDHCDVSNPALPRRVYDVVITGSAQYFGTSATIQPMVAGAQVQMIHGTDTSYTTTNSNGSFIKLYTDISCGAAFTYRIKITDFTFTSFTNIGSVNVSCSTVPCVPVLPVIVPGELIVGSLPACVAITNNTVNFPVSYSYRSRDIAFNFYNGDDYISHDTLLVFRDGIEVYRLNNQNNNGALIGNIVNMTVPILLTASGITGISFRHTYIYHEFRYNWYGYTGGGGRPVWAPVGVNPANPSLWDWGNVHTVFNDVGAANINVTSEKPNLTLGNFTKTGISTFSFKNMNTSCIDAGTHHVKIFDKPDGVSSYTQIADMVVNGLAARTSIDLTGIVSGIGHHTIKITTDGNIEIVESDETDNEIINSFDIPFPDLSIDSISSSNANPTIGSSINFKAFIKNEKNNAGPFKVSFTANGVLIGSKKVLQGLPASQSAVVISDAFQINNSDNSCPVKIKAFVDCDANVTEENENNNLDSLVFGSEIRMLVAGSEKGTPGNPFEVIKDILTKVVVPIRNLGARSTSNVKVTYRLNGQTISEEIIPLIDAGTNSPGMSSFFYTFTTAGDFAVQVITDIDNTVCEADETNNIQNFYIRVTEGKPDFVVLSQYISPGNLNPNPGQNISIASTVKNIGTKASALNTIRFLVDDVQLGTTITINGLQPGRDTTVSASTMYSSPSPGARIMKVVADPFNTEVEIREDNNEATRALVIGNAPDFARSLHQGITFNPGGFSVGDNVMVNNYIRNYGGEAASAWMRITIKDINEIIVARDSVYFTMGATDSAVISKNMLFTITTGKVITEIIYSAPMEFNEFNNKDSVNFTSQYSISQALTINGNVDMRQAVPDLIPEWIGGTILLGNNDVTIYGNVTGYDQTHFFVTNGAGKLRIKNTSAQNVFPVGISTVNPNFIVINNAGLRDNFSVGVTEGVLSNGLYGISVGTNVINRTWHIDEDIPGGSNATITLFWKPQHELPGFARLDCKIAHFAGNLWRYGPAGHAVVQPDGSYSQSQAGITDFSPFTINSGTDIILPLQLKGFTAVRHNTGVLLQWQTAFEVNVSHFEIQYSLNGIAFSTVGSVNSSVLKNYGFYHDIPYKGNNYYRLKMVDKDGSFTYSEIRLVTFADKDSMVLYPNPVQKGHSLQVNLQSILAEKMEILNAAGQVVYSTTAGQTGNIIIPVSANWASGQYTVRISNNYHVEVRKILVQ